MTGSNATAPGQYLLTLARSSGTIVVSAGDEGGPMTNGANHAGTIHRGDLDQWSFTATQNEALTLRIGEVLAGGADPGFNPWIRLRGPDGATLGSFEGALVSEIDVRAPLTGTYTVVVASYTVPTGVGQYLLTLAQAPGTFVVPADDEGGPMINGANHPGRIHRGDLDQWSFAAAQGDAITLSVGQIPGAEVAGFSPWVRLRAPDGATLGPFLGTTDRTFANQRDRTADGHVHRHYYEFSRSRPASARYLLTLAQTPGAFVVPPTDEGGPMTYGVDHPGVIHRGDLDQWTFSAVLGRPISVNTAEVATGGADPGFNPWIRLWGPDGTILGSAQGPLGARITVTAPLTGTYTVVVASFTAPSASGSYVVRVSEATPPTTVNDAYATHVNTPLVIPAVGVLANDNANGASPLTTALVTTSTDGTLTLDANGGFTYTPSPSFVGSTTFTYRAVNSVGVGNPATVTITVNPASPPTAVDDAFTLPIDFPFIVAAPGVLANDNANGGGPMLATLVVQREPRDRHTQRRRQLSLFAGPRVLGGRQLHVFCREYQRLQQHRHCQHHSQRHINGATAQRTQSILNRGECRHISVGTAARRSRADRLFSGGWSESRPGARKHLNRQRVSDLHDHGADRRVLRAHSRHRWREPQ